MTYMNMDAFGRCSKCGRPGVDTAGKCYQCEQQKYTNLPSQKILYTCPTCNGTGKVSRPPWLAGDINYWNSSCVGELHECGSCKGKGVLWQ